MKYNYSERGVLKRGGTETAWAAAPGFRQRLHENPCFRLPLIVAPWQETILTHCAGHERRDRDRRRR